MPTEGPSPEQPTKIGTSSFSQSDVELMGSPLAPRCPSVGAQAVAAHSVLPGMGPAHRCSIPALGAGVPQLGWHSLVSTLSGSGLWSLWKLAGLQLLWLPQRHLSGGGGRGLPRQMLQTGLCPSHGGPDTGPVRPCGGRAVGRFAWLGSRGSSTDRLPMCLTLGCLSSQEGHPPRLCDAHRQRADQEGGVLGGLRSR